MDTARKPWRTTIAATVLLAAGAALFCLTSSQRERGLALNTLWLVGGTCLFALPIGALLAILLARTDLPGRRTFGVVIAVLLFFPLYTQTAAWQAGFGQEGWFSMMYPALGEGPWLNGWRGAIWIHALAAVPWVTIIVGVALRSVEPQIEEAALLNGAPWQVLWRVTLPRCAFAVLAAAIWISVTSAGEITVTDMWGLRTYAEEIFRGFWMDDKPEDVAFGLLPSLTATTLVLAATLLACARWMARGHRPPARPPWTYQLGRFRWPASLFVLLVMLCLVGVPLLNLSIKLGLNVQLLPDGTYRRDWSGPQAVVRLWMSLGEFHREMIWSLGAGAVAATAALGLALPLAWWARRGGWRAWPALAVAAIFLALPGPLLGLCLSLLFTLPDRPWFELLNFLYDRSILAPAVAMMLRALPVVIILLWYALRSVPRATLEAAALDGAGPWRQLFWVALPQRKAALAAAWLIALAVAMGDLSASFLVLPPGATPLSARIFQLVHNGVEQEVAGITLAAMLAMTAIVLAALGLILLPQRGGRQSTW